MPYKVRYTISTIYLPISMSSELPKRIRGNAAVSYALIFASLAFLVSKNPYYNHPFIKSHVKVAFWLHCVLFIMFFLMSYPFLRHIKIFTLSLNDIITALLWMIVFWALFYGAYKAHKWESFWLKDIGRSAETGKSFFSVEKLDTLGEEQKALIILSHIPFFWYILAAKHRDNIKMQHIALLNLIVTTFALIIAFFWLWSLATIIFLLYIIWSVFVSLRLAFTNELTDLDLRIIPSPEEKYILVWALIIYLKNIFDSKTFVELSTLREAQRIKKYEKEQETLREVQMLPEFPYPPLLLSIPGINLIGLLYRHTRERLRIWNGFILSLLLLGVIIIFWFQSPIFLLALIPFCYHAWYSKKKEYRMPFITDILDIFLLLKTQWLSLWKKTRELQKKEVSWSFKSQELTEVKQKENTKKED